MANEWVVQESALQVDGQATLLIKRDAAKMLGVDGRRNVIWDDCATTARSHERDDYITGKNCVASQLFVFLRRDEASLRPLELIVHRVVDAENGDTAVGEFRMKQLATEWAGADCVRLVGQQIINRRDWKITCVLREKFEKGGGAEGVAEFEGVSAPAP